MESEIEGEERKREREGRERGRYGEIDRGERRRGEEGEGG